MATAYFKVTRSSDGGATIQARHPDAKQALFGWGSDENADRGSFYGRNVPESTWRGDYALWQWKLSPSAVALICRDTNAHIDDPAYYKKGPERTAALELVRKLGPRKRSSGARRRS